MTEPDFKCYVCGKPLLARFALVSMSKSVDRCFLVHEDNCAEQVADDAEETGTVAVVVRS